MKIDYAEMKATVAAAMKKGLILPPQRKPLTTNGYFREGLSFKKHLRHAAREAIIAMEPQVFADDEGTLYRVFPNGMWEKSK